MADKINIIPLMVNEKTEFSVHVAKTDDPRRMGYINFEHEGDVDAAAILQRLPRGLLAGDDTSRLQVMELDRPEGSGNRFFVVVGPEPAFSPPTVIGSSRWFSGSNFKFGPLPEGVEDASTLRDFYIGSLSPEEVAAMAAGVKTMRAAINIVLERAQKAATEVTQSVLKRRFSRRAFTNTLARIVAYASHVSPTSLLKPVAAMRPANTIAATAEQVIADGLVPKPA